MIISYFLAIIKSKNSYNGVILSVISSGAAGVKTYACGEKSVTSYDAAEIAAYDIADERCGERERNGVAQPLYLRLGKVYR